MPGTVFIQGDKIKLRTVEKEDLEFLRNGVNHPKVRVFMGNKKPQNLENQKEFFEQVICGDGTHLLICKNTERLGIISITPEESPSEKLGEIGLWLHPKHHGNGYGTEAAELTAQHGFNQLNYHKLYARAYKGNKASQKIWEKLGFQKEGKLRDHTYTQGEYKDVIYYGILHGEWQ